MGFNEWLSLFWKQIKETDLLQWIGVIFGVIEVLLARINNIGLYPAGLISITITAYIFYHSGLYAESVLNGYYFVMSVYGWWFWLRRSDKAPPKVGYADKRDWFVTAVIVLAGFGLIYFALKNYTASTVPVWDAWVTATAWAGMWLLAKRKIENWIFLNISNAFAIPLLFHKELPLYSVLTIILFIVAVQGYFKWKRLFDLQARMDSIRNPGDRINRP